MISFTLYFCLGLPFHGYIFSPSLEKLLFFSCSCYKLDTGYTSRRDGDVNNMVCLFFCWAGFWHAPAGSSGFNSSVLAIHV